MGPRPPLSPLPWLLLGLLALVAPHATMAGELTVAAGLDTAQVRDRHVSPLAYGGWAWRLGVGLDESDRLWIDRLGLTGHAGELSSSTISTLGSLERWGLDIDWRLERRVWQASQGELLVGGAWRTGLEIREGFATGWDGRSVVEPAASWRMAWAESGLTLVAGLRLPLIGILLRPGFASVLDGRDLDPSDVRLAAPHTLQGIAASTSLAWRRPGRGLRLDLAWRFERIPTPQTVESSRLTADIVIEWSL